MKSRCTPTVSVCDGRLPSFCWVGHDALEEIHERCLTDPDYQIATAIAVYTGLAYVASKHMDGNHAGFEARKEEIAEACGVTTKTLKKYVKAFVHWGLLSIQVNAPSPNRWVLRYVGDLRGNAKTTGVTTTPVTATGETATGVASTPLRGKPVPPSYIEVKKGRNTPPTPPEGGRAEKAEELFRYWVERCKHPRAKFMGKRKRNVLKRLAEGFTVEEIKAAIDGAAVSAPVTDDGVRHDDLELICRDVTTIDRFTTRGEKHKTAGVPNVHEMVNRMNERSTILQAVREGKIA